MIGFEHGLTTGINFSSSKYTHQLESTTCNLLMVCSNAAKQEFEASIIRHKDSIDNKVFVMGESDQKKNVFFPSIQRLIARRRFKIKNNKEEVVMHVSGLVYGGNIRNLSDDPVESYLFNKDKNYTNKNEIINEYIPQDEIKDLIQEDLPFIKADKIKQNEKLKYSLPDINLLKTPSKNERDDSKKDERSDPVFLEKILLDFGVDGKIKKISHGPVVTLNEFEPAAGIKVSKIINLSDDIARNTSS